MQILQHKSNQGKISTHHLPRKGQFVVYSWQDADDEEQGRNQWALGRLNAPPVLNVANGRNMGTLQDWSFDVDSYVPRDYGEDPTKYYEGRPFAYANFSIETQDVQQRGRRARKRRKQQVTVHVKGFVLVLATRWLTDDLWNLSDGVRTGGTILPAKIRDDITFAIDHFGCLTDPANCFTGHCSESHARVMAESSAMTDEATNQ